MLTASLSRQGGGLFDAVRGLARGVQAAGGAQVSAVGLADAMTAADAPAWEGVPTRACAVRGPAALGYAPALARSLRESDADLLHLHGLWMYPSAAARRWSDRTRRPVVISPHGMLDPWAVRHARWKKHLAGALYEHRNLRRAACLHALCEAEAHAIRAYGLRGPVCVIPNGVDLPAPAGAGEPAWPGAVPAGAKVLLYLGRLHPKKNVEALLRAWGQAGRGGDDWWLIIAGWDQGGHVQRLRQCAQALDVPRVYFAGPQFGAAKDACFRHADSLVLPSLSEGLPMVVLEAWSYALPVLMTPECNLPEGFEAAAALRTGTDAGAIAQGLQMLFEQDEPARRAMGGRGRALVERRYTWPRVGEQMLAVYRWSLGEGPKPAEVV